MKIIKYKYLFLIVLITHVSFGCTELASESFSDIIAEQFEPTDRDVPAIIGAAYTQLRASMLDLTEFGVIGNYRRPRSDTCDQ